MTSGYRLEDVDPVKSQQYDDDKKAQKKKQEDWLKEQKNASKKSAQPQVTAK